MEEASSPSRSARSIMYLAMRALMDPDGLRYSSLAQIPSTRTSGVSPIASKIVPPPRRTKPAAGYRTTPAEPAAGSRPSAAADLVPLVAFMPAPYVSAAAVPPSLRAGQWFRGKWAAAWGRRLQRLDQAMIFFLIAGTAIPLSCSLPAAPSGWSCLIVTWALTLAPPEIHRAR
jgi:hypothetical protein